ncbi:hypothetical protein DRN74_05080 [Candidatus Micrarchaeota archaeon]|nr:MAG: hypothetical protein DRN74_05080 [Candidatus Micrarchaeota archaeon]
MSDSPEMAIYGLSPENPGWVGLMGERCCRSLNVLRMLEFQGRLRPFQKEGFDLFFGIIGWRKIKGAFNCVNVCITTGYRCVNYSILMYCRG